MSDSYQVVPGAPSLHSVPRASVSVERGLARVSAATRDDVRVAFAFSPLQALRITTGDCYLRPQRDTGYRPFSVLEVGASPWIAELRGALAQVDSAATFLDDAHHYLIDAGDDVIEVVAWSVSWETD